MGSVVTLPFLIIAVHMSFLLVIQYLLACGSNLKEINWVDEFGQDPVETLIKVNRITDKRMSDMVQIQLLQEFPEEAKVICDNSNSPSVKEYCSRSLSRPHLWTIKPDEKILIWSGGSFNERVLFPNLEMSNSTQPSCSSDDISCITIQIKKAVEIDEPELVEGACNSYSSKRGRFDCYFRIAEKWVSVNGGYRIPVSLCQKSGAFSSECHHHLLLGLAIRNQLNGDNHVDVIDEITEYWSKYPLYASQLKELYWAIVSSRVAGVVQPFRWEEWSFLPPNHLNSALGLRLIRENDPMSVLATLDAKKDHQLEKAYGPGTPHFQPKQVWSENSQPTLYFCDIRGGRRPVHQDQKTDVLMALLTAAAMTVPPNNDLIQRIVEKNPELGSYVDNLIYE